VLWLAYIYNCVWEGCEKGGEDARDMRMRRGRVGRYERDGRRQIGDGMMEGGGSEGSDWRDA
jgi:hypothetical protein